MGLRKQLMVFIHVSMQGKKKNQKPKTGICYSRVFQNKDCHFERTTISLNWCDGPQHTAYDCEDSSSRIRPWKCSIAYLGQTSGVKVPGLEIV
jgi:hypothetical protein